MEFLKEILGDELYKQVEEKINAHNGNEANKEKQVKLGNLGQGEYVNKYKLTDLETALKGKETELGEANKLIESLKKATKSDEELQGKITAYETEKAQLQAELQETKLKSAIKVALMSEKAVDVDYLTFKLNEKMKEKGETLELDENDNIKGWADKLSGLKTQFPTMFEAAGSGNMQVLGDNRLPSGDNRKATPTKEQFAAMGYEERVALKQDNEQLYRQLAKN